MGEIARRQIWICNAFCWLKFFQDYFPRTPRRVFTLHQPRYCFAVRASSILCRILLKTPFRHRGEAFAPKAHWSSNLPCYGTRDIVMKITAAEKVSLKLRACREVGVMHAFVDSGCSFVIEITRITYTWEKWNSDTPAGLPGFVIYTSYSWILNCLSQR